MRGVSVRRPEDPIFGRETRHMRVGDIYRSLQGAAMGMYGEADKSLSPTTNKSITAMIFEG